MGARHHPMSGAGSIKNDGSTDEYLIEVKRAHHTYVMHKAEVAKLWREAVHQGKDALLVIQFPGLKAIVMFERTQ